MDDIVCRIERLDNGWEVEICDPAGVDMNKASKGMYISPWKAYAFKTVKEVVDFLAKNLEKAVPANHDDFESSFKEATSDDME